MTSDRLCVGVDVHKQLTRLREQLDELPVVGKEFLDGLVMAEVPEVREHGHESFRFERKSVHIDLCRWVSGVGDLASLDLVGEKGDNRKEPIDDIVLADNVECDRWCREELESEVLDRVSTSRSMRR